MPRPELLSLREFCLELAGLALLTTSLVVIAAFSFFGDFASPAAWHALLFAITAVPLAVLPLIAYGSIRIARLKATNALLTRAATRDGLTRVLNRATFKADAEHEIAALARRRRSDANGFTLLILDADHFKRINDRLGHHTGDEALLAIAATLQKSVRKDDLVGRLGGEEFAILLRNAGPEQARIVAERLRVQINQIEVGPRDKRTRLSVSLGGISFRNPVPFDAIYKIADANLYRAKSSGRNRANLTQLGSLATAAPVNTAGSVPSGPMLTRLRLEEHRRAGRTLRTGTDG